MNKLTINAVFSQVAMDNDTAELIRIIWIDQSEKYMQYVSISKDVAMPHPIKVEKFKELVDNGCCCSQVLSLPSPRHLPKPAHIFCRITA